MIPDKTGFFVVGNLHDLFDIIGAIATVIAAGVAVIALTNWQSQFRHAEKFKAFKELKDASTNLYLFRAYLFTIQRCCVHLMNTGGVPDETLEQEKDLALEQWKIALMEYTRAWGTAVVFLTAEEEALCTAPANVFTDRTLSDPMRIVALYANAPDKSQIHNFNEAVRAITDFAKHLSVSATVDIEIMLRQKFRT